MLRIFIGLLLLPSALAQAQTPSASDIREGKRIWQGYLGLENDCKLCHGERGEGGFAKPLAGHQLNNAQFLRVVRQGAGKTMPAFVADKNLNDQQIAQVAAYLASLPKPAEPGTMWRTPVPPLATSKQKLYIESGCGQCHAAVFANPRRTAGGLGGDYEWFKTEVYQHTSTQTPVIFEWATSHPSRCPNPHCKRSGNSSLWSKVSVFRSMQRSARESLVRTTLHTLSPFRTPEDRARVLRPSTLPSRFPC